LTRLIEDGEYRLRLALAARARFENHYSAAVVARQHADMFEQALAVQNAQAGNNVVQE
jgi:hypothetical protein